jgi:molecular chaperone DnaK (HSP70)
LGIKRYIGLNQHSEINTRNLQNRLTSFSTQTISNGLGSTTKHLFNLRTGGKSHEQSAAEIMSVLMLQAKLVSEEHTGIPTSRAVISIPFASNSSHRENYNASASIAGFTTSELSINIVNAFAAYRHFCSKPETLSGKLRGSKLSDLKNVVFFDLGGSSFDVSVVVQSRTTGQVTAVKSNGVAHLGGEDFNFRVFQYLKNEFVGKEAIWNDRIAIQECMLAIENMKIELSSHKSALWVIPKASLRDGVEYKYLLTRETFEKINMDLFETTITILDGVIKSAGLSAGDIDDVILLGRSTRIPAIPRLVEEYLHSNKQSAELRSVIWHESNWQNSECFTTSGITLDNLVVAGAALIAWDRGIYSNTSCSTSTINPDISGSHEHTAKVSHLFPSVAEHSFGVNLVGDMAKVLIPRGAMLPAKEFYGFALYNSNQPGLKIDVYQLGDSLNTRRDGVHLGALELAINPNGRVINAVMSPLYIESLKKKVYVPNVHVVFEMVDNSAIKVSVTYTVNNMSASSLFPIRNDSSIPTVSARRQDLAIIADKMRIYKYQNGVLNKEYTRSYLADMSTNNIQRLGVAGMSLAEPKSYLSSAFSPTRSFRDNPQRLRGFFESDADLTSYKKKKRTRKQRLRGTTGLE